MVMRAPRGSDSASSGNRSCTGASSSIARCSTGIMTATAVKDLVSEAMGITVSGVTGWPSERVPYPAA
jgi:hypothetical protein